MRVLIIEDEHKIANALKQGLEQESFQVDTSYDGDDGIRAAGSNTYGLIIIDQTIPGVTDGSEIVKTLRAAKNHTPVLMLVTGSSARDRVRGIHIEADDYIPKPFALQEILSRIRRLLGHPYIQSTVLKYADLVLDSVNYEVSRAGKRIKLSNREFALLEYMLRNPERILTKDTIISHVWDYSADIMPNTVEVYVRYLRNKIDKPFDGPQLIHTARGFGYKLSSEE